MFTSSTQPTSCIELVKAYKQGSTIHNTHKLSFKGVDGYDVYNISVPFEYAGKTYIAGRVEKRNTEFSTVRIFEKTGEFEYNAVFPEMTFVNMQDPFVTFVKDELVLGGVQIVSDPLHGDRIVDWHTCFYRGNKVLAVVCNRPLAHERHPSV